MKQNLKYLLRQDQAIVGENMLVILEFLLESMNLEKVPPIKKFLIILD